MDLQTSRLGGVCLYITRAHIRLYVWSSRREPRLRNVPDCTPRPCTAGTWPGTALDRPPGSAGCVLRSVPARCRWPCHHDRHHRHHPPAPNHDLQRDPWWWSPWCECWWWAHSSHPRRAHAEICWAWATKWSSRSPYKQVFKV